MGVGGDGGDCVGGGEGGGIDGVSSLSSVLSTVGMVVWWLGRGGGTVDMRRYSSSRAFCILLDSALVLEFKGSILWNKRGELMHWHCLMELIILSVFSFP